MVFYIYDDIFIMIWFCCCCFLGAGIIYRVPNYWSSYAIILDLNNCSNFWLCQ